jgi:hypothetical protein
MNELTRVVYTAEATVEVGRQAERARADADLW